MSKHSVKIILACLALAFFAATALAGDTNMPAIIPLPQKMERCQGQFRLRPETQICADAGARDAARVLSERLRRATGYPFRISPGAGRGNILLVGEGVKADLGTEGYELTVTPESVVIRAPQSAGLFYGVQTLLQLLPPEIFSSNIVGGIEWNIPCVQIEDRPRLKWRGLMLDVSRHFFNRIEVEQLLDAMALLKLNIFHWHLVDDQGWRIEIKKYPRLTQVGAWRSGIGFGLDPKAGAAYGPDGRYGGFYTQDDIREVVAYAQARHITIVPEIEMPGHSTAALAAYPQFSCTGGPFTPPLAGGVFDGIYCAGNDETFQFLQGVLSEVFQLFPGKYIHIGGDEVPKDNWKRCEKCQARIKAEGLKDEEELQSYFVRRIEKFINARGRTLIGWSEICQGGLAQNAAVMDWIGGGAEAAGEGHDVVMTPTDFCYFDHYQSTNHAGEPRAIGGYLPLSQVYSFEPVPAKLAPQFESHILGAQGNVWTEYMPSLSHVEYMVFPRACALAEVVWSAKEARNGDDFRRRVSVCERRLRQLNVNFATRY